MTYEQRVVAFVDILGFEDTVNSTVDENDKQDEKRIDEIEDALFEIKKILEPQTSWTHKVKYGREAQSSEKMTQFSDSIVVSLHDDNPSKVFAKLESLYWVPIELMRRARLICRGGVAYGYAIHTDTALFGPAINQAYRLERDAATYPRIVIHPEVLSFIKSAENEIEKFENRKIEDILARDEDGLYYIDYFKPLPGIFENGEWLEYKEILDKTVKDGLKSPKPGVFAKYMWMASKMRANNL